MLWLCVKDLHATFLKSPSAMRIISGKWRGRALKAPTTHDIRPTSDRLRETLFNILAHHPAVQLDGARVLDLFAGTGALGLEALSRGAEFSLFVDDGIEARGVLRENIHTLGAQGQSRIFRRDATQLGAIQGMPPFTLVFADPPYGNGLAEKALQSALDGGWIAANAIIVIEEDASATVQLPKALVVLDTRETARSKLLIAQNAAS